MNIFFSPQVNNVDILTYTIEGEIITATLNGLSDIIDFSALPDGIAENITSDLSVNPFINAERENGVLYVELLNYITTKATEFEKFPVWIEV